MTTAPAWSAAQAAAAVPAPGCTAAGDLRFSNHGGTWAYRSRGFRALEHTFRIRSDDGDCGPFLDTVFQEFVSEHQVAVTYSLVTVGSGEARRLALYANEERICLARTESRRLSILLWHVNQQVIRRTSPYNVLLHAAAAERDGVCVVLPAEMESGKTTTVAGLLLAGYRYLTDEAVAIDPESLLVSPFPKALSVDRGSWPVLPELQPAYTPVFTQWQVPPRGKGLRGTAQPHRPRLLVTPRYVEGAPTALERLSRGDAVLLVAQSTFEFAVRARRNLTVAARVAESCDAYRLTIGDLPTAVVLIDELVDDVLRRRS